MSEDVNLIKFTHSISVLHSAQVTAFENVVKNGGDILKIRYNEQLKENKNKPQEVTAISGIGLNKERQKKIYDAQGKIIYIRF